MRVAPIFLVACLLATLPAACAAPPPEVSGWLQPVVAKSYEATSPDYRGTLLTALIGHEAYAAATILAGEALGREKDDLSWEAAQGQADTHAAYRADAQQRLAAAVADVRAAADELAAASAGEVARADAGRLLLAARLLVEADAALAHATAAHDAMTVGDGVTPLQRIGLGRGVGIAAVAAEAAASILDGFEPSGGQAMDLERARANAARIDDGAGEVIEGAGPLFTVAKATHTWESQFLPAPNETLADLEAALADSGRHRELLTDRGLGTEAFDSVMHDAAAWLAEAETQYTEPAWIPLVSTIYGQVLGAQFEAEALTLDPPAEDGGMGRTLLWFAGAAAAGALVALAFLVWRRRKGEAHLLLVLLVAVAAVQALPQGSAATLVDPSVAPAPVPDSTGVAGLGNMVQLDDGRFQFAWSEKEGGIFVVLERKYDAGSKTWTSPTKLYGDDINSNSPRLLKVGSQVHLFWMHGYESSSDQNPVEVWWCVVGAQGCTGARSVTPTGLRVLQFAPSAAPNGDVWLAYSEWRHELGSNVARIQLRARLGGTWGEPILLHDGSLSQTLPSVAAVAGGVHVAWQQVPMGSGGDPSKTAQLRYAFVPNSGAVPESEQIPGVPRSGGIAIHAGGDQITILFDRVSSEGRPTNLYEVHRDGGGAFSAPANVSRGAQNPLWPSLRDGPDGSLVAVWAESDQTDNFVLRAAIRRDGAWSRPLALSPPGYMAVLPSFVVEDSGMLDIAWSGTGAGNPSTLLYFRRIMPVWPSLPPVIVGTDPDGSKWVGGEPVQLRVHVIADWPLDVGGSSVLVDGKASAVEAGPDGLLARASGVGDGPHEAKATVRDRNGGTATTTWSFSVDRSPPAFSWRVANPDGSQATPGWSTAALKVSGDLTQDSGAPAHLELQLDQGAWSKLPADGFTLPEGRLLDTRVRSVDEAGNVQLGTPVEVGWDATPPQVVFDGQGGWQGSAEVLVTFRDNATAGSPLTVQVRLFRGSELLATQSATGSPGVAKFPGVPEGRYRVEATAEDAAGHDGGSSSWEIGVDRTLPRLRLTPLGNGSVQADAEDAGSGVARVELRRGGEVVATFDGSGRAAFQVAFPLPAGTDVAVVDLTGHEAVERAAGSGSAVDDGAYDVGPRETGGKGTPGPGLLLLALGLLLASRSRR